MKGFKVNNFLETKAVPISIIAGLMGFVYVGVLSFLNSYSQEIDLVDAASFFFIIYTMFILVSRPFTGKLMDTKGESIVVYPALILFSIGLTVLSMANSGFVLLLSGALIGLGFGTLIPALQTIAIKQSPRHKTGLAISTYFIFIDGGAGVGTYLMGYLIPILGFRGLYFSLSVIVFGNIFLYYLLHGRHKKVKEQYSRIGLH